MGEIHSRLAEAAGMMPSLGKDELNREQGFSFRSIEAIVSEAKPVLAKLGVSITPHKILSHESEPVESKRGAKGFRTVVVVEYEVGCETDSFLGQMAGEAIDYGDKSTSKAVQMAFKYFLTDALLVASEDADSAAPTVSDGPVKPDVRVKRAFWEHYGPEEAEAMYYQATEGLDVDEVLADKLIAGLGS